MAKKKTINVPLNRVEGDLEIRVELTDDLVSDSWAAGVMYRGFEQIMIGRGALDGLVITPRICGICTTSHLAAAAKALDMIGLASPPPDAIRVRNLALMTEHLMSDIRHGFMMYAADFVNPAYKDQSLFEEAVRRYEPFRGETVVEVVRETKKILGIIAIVGGQWPHSSYMVPGGIASVPSGGDLLQGRLLLRQYRKWYEQRILGCPLERFREVKSQADLENWLEENENHKNSDLGFYIRFARSIGLDRIGGGHDNFITYGSLVLPEDSLVSCPEGSACLLPGGFARGTEVGPMDHNQVAEYVTYSWFEDYQGSKHPFEGLTKPYASGDEGLKYSWAKAPRYNDLPAETGPLAEAIIGKNPLVTDLYNKNGSSAFLRELARLIRPAKLIPAMEIWLSENNPGRNILFHARGYRHRGGVRPDPRHPGRPGPLGAGQGRPDRTLPDHHSHGLARLPPGRGGGAGPHGGSGHRRQDQGSR